MHRPIFSDRHDAGRQLAARLKDLAGTRGVQVLGLARGGVPVAFEIAQALRAPLDVFVVRKLGVPGHPELAMGAIASGDVRVMNADVVQQLGIPEEAVAEAASRELRELDRREQAYRQGRPRPSLAESTIVLVDDGIATGATMRAAVTAARKEGAHTVIVAAPVISVEAEEALSSAADRVEFVATPGTFGSVGEWYDDFVQMTDQEVARLLEDANSPPAAAHRPDATTSTRVVHIPIGDAEVMGDLTIPASVKGIVIFAHGGGSSRLSPRNQDVANALTDAGYATLLFDLLTSSEESSDRYSGQYRFDVDLLARRLALATEWLMREEDMRQLRLGYFGASTGAAAALVAAARRHDVRCVVSRGGRPDLAGDALPKVHAATLLIVGDKDHQVLALNRAARLHLRSCESRLAIVPGATHLFQEPGALERVSRLATAWFDQHLAPHVLAHAGV
jgi:putative phosphoribosyl transferase